MNSYKQNPFGRERNKESSEDFNIKRIDNEDDTYTKNLKKVITIKEKVFEQKKNQIFYKEKIPSKLDYYRRRITIIIIILFLGFIPGILLICILFFHIKPWNRFLLINNDNIGYYNKGNLYHWTKKLLLNKNSITKIDLIGKTKSIYVYYKKKYNGKEKYFYFGKIHNFNKLITILKKQGYRLIYK